MKQTVFNFNQQAILDLTKIDEEGKEIKLDATDLLILDWFIYFTPKMTSINVNGKIYYWLSYSKLQEDLPFLDFKKRTFTDKLKKLCELEVLDFHYEKNQGSITYYGFGNNYIKLIEETNRVALNVGGCSKNYNGVAVKTTTGLQSGQQPYSPINNNSINNNSINDNSIINNTNINKENIIINNNIKENENQNDKTDEFDFENIFPDAPKLDEKPKKVKSQTEQTIFDIYIYYMNKSINYGYAKIKKDKFEDIPIKQVNSIKKILKQYPIDVIYKTIDRYFQVISDKTYYFDTWWNIEKFFGQGNSFVEFLEDGLKWVNYINRQQKNNYYNNQPSEPVYRPRRNDNDF